MAEPVPGDRRGLVDRVLSARGLDQPERAAAFLDCSLMHLHDPSQLPGIDRACVRILEALANREPIAIYGDYDVDGITATAILYHTLRHIDPTAEVRTYVPHRLEEGYGLNNEAIEQLASEGVRVVVSVDCGITAVEQARAAGALGIDLIITDHHNPRSDGVLPEPYALVHPRLPGSAYPFGELCGAGVAYKLAWKLAVTAADQPDGRADAASRELLIDLLAFTALGSIADMVPLDGENRILTKFGLSRIRNSRCEGLRALVAASGLDSAKVEADDVGFRLAPRLNACGRMGHAADAVELFTSAKGERADAIADQLHRQNTHRQSTERAIVEQACEMAESAGMTGEERRAIVLCHESWHPGVVGIVCSRLVERYARPTILLCADGEIAKGSGRSIPGYNLHAGLDATATHLLTYGGHDAAAGMSLRTRDVDAFTDAFIEHAGSVLAPDDLANEIRIDCQAEFQELTVDTIRQLGRLKPFGRGNPKVRLLICNARLVQPASVFGKQAQHLSLQIGSDQNAGSLRCIAWNKGGLRDMFTAGQRIDAVLTPEVSSFSGAVEPLLEDWRPA